MTASAVDYSSSAPDPWGQALREVFGQSNTATAPARSFREWNKAVTPQWNWDWRHLVAIQDALDQVATGRITRLVIECPPRHGKSEAATIRHPVWRLESAPAMRVVMGAYNQTLANKFSRKARRIAERRLKLSADRTAVEDWETTEGGGVRAVGVGAGITGQGADLIIIDDPVKSREEAESQAYRDRVWEWYTDDMYTRLEPGAAIVVIMTRWHHDDLVGRILASEDAAAWTVLRLPALAEPGDPLGRTEGEALCPDRYDEAALARIKRVMGTSNFSALYQQSPTPPGGGIIKPEWFRRYRRAELPPVWHEVILSWDMTFKDTDGTDYVVGQVWGRAGADCYLLAQVRRRMDFVETVAAFTQQVREWPGARAKLIEDKANGPAVISMLRRKIPGLIAVEPDGSKVARAYAVTPMLESRNVYIPADDDAAWVKDFCQECEVFPNGSYDDQVDAMTQALNRLSGRAGRPWPAAEDATPSETASIAHARY